MVQMFNVGPGRKQVLKQTLGNLLSQGIPSFTTGYYANKALNDVIGDSSYKNAPHSEKTAKLIDALQPYGEYGQNILAKRLGIEQMAQQEKQQGILSKAIRGEELSPEEEQILPPEIQLKREELKNKQVQARNIRKVLKKAGVPDEYAEPLAELFENSPQGGQTEIIKGLNDFMRRAKQGEFKEKSVGEKENIEEDEFEWPEIPEPENLLPAEKVRQEADQRKHNLPLYEEANKRLFGLEDEYRDIQRLNQLNERRNLPEGIEKWNIDWETGEPRALALLHTDAQLYTKTIANMFGKAKEFFPGRVTNFDLETFKKRFPTLANSFEGRKLIAKQLELANRIAYLKDETYQKAVEHYGSGADPVLIRKYANNNYKRLKNDLEDRLKNLDGLLEEKYKNEEENSSSNKSEKPSLEDIF